MDAADLSRWTRFAAKGGIGKCTATQDCVAESGEDLMFLKDDEITVLMQIPDSDSIYLGYCEGVVGRFHAQTVHFHSKLKRPVMTKRNSAAMSSRVKSPTAMSPSPPYRGSSSSTPVSSNPPTPLTPAFTTGVHRDVPNLKRSSTAPSHAHTPSEASTSTAGIDFGLPRVMSPPSMYDESNLHMRQPSITSVLSEKRLAESDSDVDQVLIPKRSDSITSSKSRSSVLPKRSDSIKSFTSTLRSESPSSIVKPSGKRKSTISHTSSNYLGNFTDEESNDPRISMASTGSDGEVGIGLSLLASLGDGDSDDDFEDERGYQNAGPGTRSGSGNDRYTDSGSSVDNLSVRSRPLSPSSVAISEEAVAAFPRPPSSQFAVVTSSDPVNPFGTFGQSVMNPAVRGAMGSLFEDRRTSAHTSHPSITSSESFGTDSAVSKETDSSESGEATTLGHPMRKSQPEAAPSPTQGSARSESVYSSSSQHSLSRKPASPDHPPVFPPPNFRFPAQQLEQSDVRDSFDILPPHRHSPSLSRTSGASTSDWEGASDIYDNYLYRYSMASKNSRHSQLSVASKTGFSIPSTSTMPPVVGGGTRSSLTSPTPPHFHPLSVQTNASDPDLPSAVPETSEPEDSQESLDTSFSADSTDTNETITPSQIPPRYDSLTMQRSASIVSSLHSRGSRRSIASSHHSESPHQSDESDDDESIYSRLSSKPSLSLLEAHAASLLAPERVNTTAGLNVVKNSPSPSASTFPEKLFGKNLSHRPSPLDLTNQTPVSNGANGVGPSPLLHTRWGSPVSSTGMSAGSTYDDISSGGYPTPPFAELRGSDDERDKITGGQMREHPQPQRAETLISRSDGPDTSLSTLSSSSRPLVIDDDEELPSHAIDPEEGEMDMSLTTMGSADSRYANDSMQSADSQYADDSMQSAESRYTDDSRTSVESSLSSPKTKNESMGVPHLVITSKPPVPGFQVTSPASSRSPSGTSPISAVSPYSPGDLPMDLMPNANLSQFPPSLIPGKPIPRPSLAELRGYPDSAFQGQRQSLFLPHPNAPKAPVESPGPMISNVGNSRAPPMNQLREGPDPKKISSYVLRMVLNTPPPPIPPVMLPPPSSMPIRGARGAPPPAPPPPLPRGLTIYARVDVDLSTSNGPVPITFSVEPMGPPPLPLYDPMTYRQPPAMQAPPSPRRGFLADGQQYPQSQSPQPNTIRRSATASASLPTTSGARTVSNPTPPPGNVSPSPVLGQQYQRSQSPQVNNIRRSATTSASVPIAPVLPSASPSPIPPSAPGAVIPRENFTPQVSAMRPRSRSFSAGSASVVASKDNPSPMPNIDNPPPLLRARGSSASLSSSPMVPASSSPTPSSSSLRRPASNSKLRTMHSPSPLSMPFNNTSRSPSLTGAGVKPPSSPLASGFTINGRPSQLRKVTSLAALPAASSGRSSFSKTADNGIEESHPTSPTRGDPPRQSSDRPSRRDSDTMSISSSRSQAMSPPLVGRQSSLQMKLSMPNLRRGSLREVNSSMGINENETMQVKDTDFELVRPNFPIVSQRSSEDSSSPGLPSRRSESRATDGVPLQLRSESPAISVSSGISGTSRITTGVSSDSAAFRSKASSKASDSEASMDAHRQREQKWMNVISTIPASQAYKNKKVRKLLGEGVPSSVRYLVWAHLTNAKSKGVAGVYSQLSKRVRVAAFADIERDVKRCFGEHPHLQSTQGPLLSVLQAYLTMVPDVQYSTGLTLIAGHTLLLAPEEDGFWIFVSMMDSVLRPYFSLNTTQMEVDAALFSRALETNDTQVSKKVLVDMGINPAHVCFPWFTTLFVGSLPGDYVNRVWDLFLYEGVPVLIRVGLAIVYCCRRAILDATAEDAVLFYLKRPSPTWLPPTPDAFITLAYSFKVKDDDVRKQRVKMEKQIKKTVSQGARLVANGGISLPRDA